VNDDVQAAAAQAAQKCGKELDSRRPGKRATLDQVRDEAARLWHDDEVRKRAWEAVDRLKTQYTVRYEQ